MNIPPISTQHSRMSRIVNEAFDRLRHAVASTSNTATPQASLEQDHDMLTWQSQLKRDVMHILKNHQIRLKEKLTSLLPDFDQAKILADLLSRQTWENADEHHYHYRFIPLIPKAIRNQIGTQIDEIFQTIILPRITINQLEERVNQVPLPTEQASESEVNSQAVKITQRLVAAALNNPLTPVQIELIPGKAPSWKVNRNFTKEDVGSMVALLTLDGETVFARIDFKNDKFCLRISGIADEDLIRGAAKNKLKVQAPFSNEPYNIYINAGLELKPVKRVGQTFKLLQTTKEKSSYLVTVAAIGREVNPLVRLNMPEMSPQEKVNLQKNIAIRRSDNKLIYGRVIYQFPDGSTTLSLWDPPPVETPAAVRQRILDHLQDTMMQPINTRIKQILGSNIKEEATKILDRPEKIGSITEVLQKLLPTHLQTNALATLMKEGSVPTELTATLQASIRQAIKLTILPRITEPLLQNCLEQHTLDYENYPYDANDIEFKDKFIASQARSIAKTLLMQALHEPLTPLQIKYDAQSNRYTLNRDLTLTDVDSMVAVPLLHGKTAFTRIDFTGSDFIFKISGINFTEDLPNPNQLVKIHHPFSQNKYFLTYRKGREKDSIRQVKQRLDLRDWNVTDNTSFSATVIAIGTEDSPFVRLAMPAMSQVQKQRLQRNIVVIRNETPIYGRVIYQFPDGSTTESHWQDAPLISTPDALIQEIANVLQIQTLAQQVQRNIGLLRGNTRIKS